MVDQKKAKKDEEEYFKKKDAELLKKMKEEQAGVAEKQRLHQLKDLHYMHCPKCGCDLEERKYEEVKIDVCTNCDGIWLDKGELDLLRKKEGFLIQHIMNIFK